MEATTTGESAIRAAPCCIEQLLLSTAPTRRGADIARRQRRTWLGRIGYSVRSTELASVAFRYCACLGDVNPAKCPKTLYDSTCPWVHRGESLDQGSHAGPDEFGAGPRPRTCPRG